MADAVKETKSEVESERSISESDVEVPNEPVADIKVSEKVIFQ